MFEKSQNDLFIFKRIDDKKEILCCFNLGNKIQKIPKKFNFKIKIIFNNYCDTNEQNFLRPFEVKLFKIF